MEITTSSINSDITNEGNRFNTNTQQAESSNYYTLNQNYSQPSTSKYNFQNTTFVQPQAQSIQMSRAPQCNQSDSSYNSIQHVHHEYKYPESSIIEMPSTSMNTISSIPDYQKNYQIKQNLPIQHDNNFTHDNSSEELMNGQFPMNSNADQIKYVKPESTSRFEIVEKNSFWPSNYGNCEVNNLSFDYNSQKIEDGYKYPQKQDKDLNSESNYNNLVLENYTEHCESNMDWMDSYDHEKNLNSEKLEKNHQTDINNTSNSMKFELGSH